MLEFLLFFIGMCYIKPFYYLRLYLQVLYPFISTGYILPLLRTFHHIYFIVFSYLLILFYLHADFPVRSLAVQCCLLS